jgi:hypothetical protein
MTDNTQHAIDGTLAAVGTKATYTGAGAASVSWFLSSEFGILVGVVIGVAGLIAQIYYSRKRDKREQAIYELKMTLRSDRHELLDQGADE